MKKALIYGRFVRSEDFPYIQEIIDCLEGRDIMISVIEDYYSECTDGKLYVKDGENNFSEKT